MGDEAEALNDWFAGCEVDDRDSLFYVEDAAEARKNRDRAWKSIVHVTDEKEWRAKSGFATALSVHATICAMKERYAEAKAAKVGDIIKCATCGKTIKKRQYSQAFCSSRGCGNCRDRYHNSVKVDRLERAKKWSRR